VAGFEAPKYRHTSFVTNKSQYKLISSCLLPLFPFRGVPEGRGEKKPKKNRGEKSHTEKIIYPQNTLIAHSKKKPAILGFLRAL
jgi:hypothetical protein